MSLQDVVAKLEGGFGIDGSRRPGEVHGKGSVTDPWVDQEFLRRRLGSSDEPFPKEWVEEHDSLILPSDKVMRDLVVGGELGLVELARRLGGLGHGRHGQLVGGEVVKVCQLGHERSWSLLSGPLGINPPLVVVDILRRLVVEDVVINLAVDQEIPRHFWGAPFKDALQAAGPHRAASASALRQLAAFFVRRFPAQCAPDWTRGGFTVESDFTFGGGSKKKV